MMQLFAVDDFYWETDDNSFYQLYAHAPLHQRCNESAQTPDKLVEIALAGYGFVTLRMYTNYKQRNFGQINVNPPLLRET